MEGDEARRGAWLVDVPLSITHRLRAETNNGKPVSPEVLERYEIPIVASALKLYLLELPDSLVSSHVYEIIKTIYTTPASESTDSARIAVLTNTLSQLRLANIATLDAIMTHFTRLIDLTSAEEDYVAALAHNLAPCILRPRIENAMTMEEKHAYRLIRDLFAHKEAIFSELKRASSLSHSASVNGQRPRAISTDESTRKANMEARTRAILAASSSPLTNSRSRAASPAPGSRNHRRDRSSGGPETRFPIQTSPTTDSRVKHDSINSVVRNSLEVPSSEGSPVFGATSSTPLQSVQSVSTGNGDYTTDGADIETGVEKRNSLGRSAHAGASRFGPARRLGPSKGSLSSLESKPAGVSLTDKPMDD